MLAWIPAEPQNSAIASWITLARQSVIAAIPLLASASAFAQTIADPEFDVSVAMPTYTREHPRVVIDEAHHNFHTAEGRYKPFAELLRNDGYDVEAGAEKFETERLHTVRVLIVANARGGDDQDASKAAFTAQECDAVREWVRTGGALLLIADHAPFGRAAYDLALRFGVDMGKGYVFDPRNSEGDPTILVFSRANGLLGDHPITAGRNNSERVQRVVAFTGQSVSVPRGAVALMRLALSSYEADTYSDGKTKMHGARPARTAPNGNAQVRPVGNRAQGIAMEFGKGRVIIVGEAAMFSAQLLKSDQQGKPDLRFGMNAPGNDDRQFALNAVHWLSAAFP